DIDYGRLEVSSPGLDRPLKQARDFVRFAGSRITIRLRAPFQGRRNFEGLLSVEEAGRFCVELVAPEPTVPRTPGAARAAAK
ncbi:MAG: ribosome maturation factor RimP, partial [Betaproteobacteria bacterium]